MSNWKFIKPTATTNLFTDPSFFLADPDTEWTFAGDGAEDWTRSTTHAMFGVSSALMDIGGGSYADLRQTFTTTATSYTVSCYVRRSAGGTVTASHTQAYFDDANVAWDSITQVNDSWYYCVYTGTATAAANAFGMRGLEDGMYVDGMQLENLAYATTYCDGTQEGCEWTMGQHTSSSSRSGQSRAGGRVVDFGDNYSFYPTGWTGWGVAPTSLGVDSYALLPGGQLNSVRVHEREFAITGLFHGTSLSNLHSIRDALEEELVHDRYPQTGAGWQPVTIRYEGATVHKEIRAHYAGGLEGGIRSGFTENCAIRFNATDPYWYELGNDAAVLDSNDAATLRYCAGRLRSTGQWDDLGLTANPDTAGTIYAICVASDGSVYFGGNFEDWNNAGAGGDTIIRFDPSDESWNILVGANEIAYGAGVVVYDIKEGPDGTIYICGAFTDVGDANGDAIVSYNPTADTWTSLGAPDINVAGGEEIRAMAFDSAGDLYVVGDFADVAGVANTAYIARWDMADSDWNAIGAPSVGAGYPSAIAIDSQDNIVLGGTFTNFAGDADADYLARWDGSAWADLGSGTQSGDVYALAFSSNDTLYLGGNFTNQGGDADCDYICGWNGRQFIPLYVPSTALVQDIAIAPDARVFAAAGFRGPGDVASWNGSAWEIWDTNTYVLRIAIGPADPTVPGLYDIWIGDDASAAREIAGTATVTNNGTAPQHPILKVSRSGGTSATLYTLGNETTGKRLMFNYSLLDGETLTVDCRPDKQSITSSFFGPRPDAILANCDFGSFVLQAGANQITCFVDVAGAPTITAWLEWRTPYKGAD